MTKQASSHNFSAGVSKDLQGPPQHPKEAQRSSISFQQVTKAADPRKQSYHSKDFVAPEVLARGGMRNASKYSKYTIKTNPNSWTE